MSKINFLLKIIHTLKRDKLWESIKWSPKRKYFDLWTNSLNYFFKEMYGHQFGEFVRGYWGLKGSRHQRGLICYETWDFTCKWVPSLRHRRNLTPVSNVCEAEAIPLFWSPNGLSQLAYRKCILNRPLPKSKTLTFKMRLGAQPFLWKWVLFAWEWKMISISKAEHLPSFWNRGPGELGNGLFPFNLISKLTIYSLLTLRSSTNKDALLAALTQWTRPSWHGSFNP